MIALLFSVSLTLTPVRDTLPPYRDEDIDTILTSYAKKAITIRLKDGTSHTFSSEAQWHSTMPEGKVKSALGRNDRIFTQVENPPTYPGGIEAWEKYMKDFCARNKVSSRDQASVIVMFAVDLDGETSEFQVTEGDYGMSKLAIQAIKESGNWIPARQNGRIVIAYARQRVDFPKP